MEEGEVKGVGEGISDGEHKRPSPRTRVDETGEETTNEEFDDLYHAIALVDEVL